MLSSYPAAQGITPEIEVVSRYPSLGGEHGLAAGRAHSYLIFYLRGAVL
jgi:hypothetical protein